MPGLTMKHQTGQNSSFPPRTKKRKHRSSTATVIAPDEPASPRKLPPRILAAVKEALQRGIDPDTIAIQLDVPPSKVRAIMEREGQQASGRRHSSDETKPLTALRAEIERILRLIPTAETEYIQTPDVDNARALTALTSEVRALIAQAERMKEPRDEFRDVAEDIIQPIITSFIQVATRILAELRSTVTQNMPSKHRDRVGAEFIEKMKEISEVMKTQYDDAVAKLAVIYAIDLDENPEEKSRKKLSAFKKSE